ncbi:MAG: uncharacterized protein PWQ42_497 [Sulfurospirillum sp.]|jgi:predicted nucleotidyltransferase|nr:uncharacterized protein [Sulfurospirillum sp.]DAB33238.1 MAG TPA: hypothetical protein CFH82_11535 [Sulfurospirillum sp. UBA12182]
MRKNLWGSSMTKEDILSFIKTHKQEFREKYSIDNIALFGSFAKGLEQENSDIDLLVTYIQNPGDIYTKKRALKKLLQEYFCRKVDIANEQSLRPFAKEAILKDAIYVR